MKRNHERDRHQPRAATTGFTTAAAIVLTALFLAGAEKVLRPAADATPAVELGTASEQATEYFPSGYTLQANEPDEHVEAF